MAKASGYKRQGGDLERVLFELTSLHDGSPMTVKATGLRNHKDRITVSHAVNRRELYAEATLTVTLTPAEMAIVAKMRLLAAAMKHTIVP